MGTKHAISTSPATIKFLMQRARGHLKSRYVGACRRVAGVSVVFVMVLLRFLPNKKFLVDKHYFPEIAYSTCPGCIPPDVATIRSLALLQTSPFRSALRSQLLSSPNV